MVPRRTARGIETSPKMKVIIVPLVFLVLFEDPVFKSGPIDLISIVQLKPRLYRSKKCDPVSRGVLEECVLEQHHPKSNTGTLNHLTVRPIIKLNCF